MESTGGRRVEFEVVLLVSLQGQVSCLRTVNGILQQCVKS